MDPVTLAMLFLSSGVLLIVGAIYLIDYFGRRGGRKATSK